MTGDENMIKISVSVTLALPGNGEAHKLPTRRTA